MKRLFLGLSALLLLFAGCKENDPVLTFSTANYVDTSYIITPVPTAQPHNALVEEFTGQGCSNCPAAHTTLESISGSNPGRVNIVGLYITNFSQTTPPAGYTHDFRNDTASLIGSLIYGGVNQMPIAGIDRTETTGSDYAAQIGQGSWASDIATQMNVADSLNLTITSSFNSSDSLATIITTITYTQNVSTLQNLTIELVEDSIIDIQEYPAFDPAYPSGYDSAYVFTNVFRGMATGSNVPYGDPILGKLAIKPAGQVDQRTYTYKLPTISPAINPAHCRIIAFVSYPNGGQVLQSAQCPLE